MKLQMFVPVFHTFKCQHFFPASIFFVPVCSLFILMCAWTESELRVLLFAQRAPLNRLRGIQSQSSALVSTCQSLGELCRPCDNTYPPTPTQTREHGGGRGGGDCWSACCLVWFDLLALNRLASPSNILPQRRSYDYKNTRVGAETDVSVLDDSRCL